MWIERHALRDARGDVVAQLYGWHRWSCDLSTHFYYIFFGSRVKVVNGMRYAVRGSIRHQFALVARRRWLVTQIWYHLCIALSMRRLTLEELVLYRGRCYGLEFLLGALAVALMAVFLLRMSKEALYLWVIGHRIWEAVLTGGACFIVIIIDVLSTTGRFRLTISLQSSSCRRSSWTSHFDSTRGRFGTPHNPDLTARNYLHVTQQELFSITCSSTRFLPYYPVNTS